MLADDMLLRCIKPWFPINFPAWINTRNSRRRRRRGVDFSGACAHAAQLLIENCWRARKMNESRKSCCMGHKLHFYCGGPLLRGGYRLRSRLHTGHSLCLHPSQAQTYTHTHETRISLKEKHKSAAVCFSIWPRIGFESEPERERMSPAGCLFR